MAEENDAPSPMAAAMFWRQQQERNKRQTSRPKPEQAPADGSAKRPEVRSPADTRALAAAMRDFEATAALPPNSPARERAVKKLRDFSEANPDNTLARNALEVDTLARRAAERDKDVDRGSNARLSWLQNRDADTMERAHQKNPDALLASVAGDRGWYGDKSEQERVAAGRPTSGLSPTEQAQLEAPAPDWLMRAARRNPYDAPLTPPPSRVATVDPNTLAVVPSLTESEGDPRASVRPLFRRKPTEDDEPPASGRVSPLFRRRMSK